MNSPRARAVSDGDVRHRLLGDLRARVHRVVPLRLRRHARAVHSGGGHLEPVVRLAPIYDPDKRDIAEPPPNEREVDLGDLKCAIDLTDGALVAIGHTMIGTTSAYLLEPKGTLWQNIAKLPKLDAERAFAGPDGKVYLLDDRSPRSWDPRSGQLAVLGGANPMRGKAAVVSLDPSHLLIAGRVSSSTASRPGSWRS